MHRQTESVEAQQDGDGARWQSLKAPFPYFGGKRTIAEQVWQWIGAEVPNYVEPFFGSGAVLLNRPSPDPRRHLETVNDVDGLLCNAWRAIQAAPAQTAYYADWPSNENDLHARHAWLVGQKDSLQAHLEGDPDYYDAKIAGWWLWGMACWIGREFCSGKGPWQVVDGQLLDLGDAGQGIHHKRIRLGNTGQGIHRQRIHLGDAGEGIQRQRGEGLLEYFHALQGRFRRVRVCCGDWQRVLGPAPTTRFGLTGVFLDPPYSHALRDKAIYRTEADIAPAVQAWCLTHGTDPFLRIVLCGYGAEHDVLLAHGWYKWTWKTQGGYGNLGQGRGLGNAALEACWVSPHCHIVPSPQLSLFSPEAV